MTFLTTWILQLATFAPETVLTVMVAVPTFTPVTLPFESTLTTDLSLDDQITDLSVAFDGFTVALIVPELPASIYASLTFRETEVTG